MSKKRKTKDKHFLEITSNLTGHKTLYGNPIKRYRITSWRGAVSSSTWNTTKKIVKCRKKKEKTFGISLRRYPGKWIPNTHDTVCTHRPRIVIIRSIPIGRLRAERGREKSTDRNRRNYTKKKKLERVSLFLQPLKVGAELQTSLVRHLTERMKAGGKWTAI